MRDYLENPNWLRPLSGQISENWGNIPRGNDFEAHKLLVVGGEHTYIPKWLLLSDISLKHIKTASNLIEEIAGFNPDAVLIYVKAADGHTKHQTKDYSNRYNIPYLIMHRGWSDLILDAKAKGVNWLVSAYPHSVVPLDYYERRSKSRQKKIRRKKKPSAQLQRFRSIRGNALQRAGITRSDLSSGSVVYVDDHKDTCVLCGRDIKYRYRLSFEKRKNVSTFFPVGSVCIEDWMNSLPERPSREKVQQILGKRWKGEATQLPLFDLD